MKKRLIIVGGVLSLLLVAGLTYFFYLGNFSKETLFATSNPALSGGEGTAFIENRDAFAKPLANLPTTDLRQFTFGNKIFNTNWVTAPASVKSLDGLGPTFNRVSCSGCHFKDGRGQPPHETGGVMNSMLVRLSIPGKATDGGPNPHPIYGGQLNDKAIHGVMSEGIAVIHYQEIKSHYADGTEYQLQKPEYSFLNLNFGPVGPDLLFSPRVASPVHGLGLLEAVEEKTITDLADPEDDNEDGISGRPNYVWDKINQKKSIGRFGWKANQPSLEQQDSDAAVGDIGITTSVNPVENCPAAQTACTTTTHGGVPEMSDLQRQKLLFYTQTLAVPARRHLDNEQVQLGEKLFKKLNCNACHTDTIKTGEHKIAALSNQVIHPYTDLLLHDMGNELSDKRPDYEATGNEWRTPPLWGIGLTETVNGHTNFLHDGRARNLEEAILWHGGEGLASKEMFTKLSEKERKAVIAFLESL